VVTEIDPLKALEATMDGFRVMTAFDAAKVGDFFCTVTGNTSVLAQPHFEKMKDGAIVANSGHFNVEIDIAWLEKNAKKTTAREFVDEYRMKSGNRIAVLGEGRLINLASAEGHPSSVMDMSFANQALSAEYVVKNSKKLAKEVYPVPENIDKEIARLKLKAMGVKIDKLTAEQEKYVSSWHEGT
jgi:adenosylhomocysteinase